MENREYISPTIASVGPTAQIGVFIVDSVVFVAKVAIAAVAVQVAVTV